MYESTAQLEQRIPVEDAQSIVAKCHCPELITRVGSGDVLVLEIEGKFSIVGYHGSREDAGAKPLSKNAIAFTVERENGILVLKSPEWRHIHHALELTRVVAWVPPTVEFIVEREKLSDS